MSSIKIINASCADQEVDAVVNAANKWLLGGSGICGAIFYKAGHEQLEEECSKINTPLNDGDAVITPSFNMSNCKYIIHAVGPDFYQTPDAFEELYKAYYNSLKVLKENNLHTISFPLISSGIYGGDLENPVQVSTENCLKAYNDFINKENYEIDVILCAFTISEYEEAKKIFNI